MVSTTAAARWKITASDSIRTTTDYGTNADGKSYGAAKDEDEDPDLIAAYATNGRPGYVYADDLNEPLAKSPAEAGEWMEENAGKSRTIPVYTEDGHTVIGEFVIDPGTVKVG